MLFFSTFFFFSFLRRYSCSISLSFSRSALRCFFSASILIRSNKSALIVSKFCLVYSYLFALACSSISILTLVVFKSSMICLVSWACCVQSLRNPSNVALLPSFRLEMQNLKLLYMSLISLTIFSWSLRCTSVLFWRWLLAYL